jgi:hypothetical protein
MSKVWLMGMVGLPLVIMFTKEYVRHGRLLSLVTVGAGWITLIVPAMIHFRLSPWVTFIAVAGVGVTYLFRKRRG